MQDLKENKTESQQTEEKIPLFRSWNGWYTAVLFVLVVLILFFYLFTNRFA